MDASLHIATLLEAILRLYGLPEVPASLVVVVGHVEGVIHVAIADVVWHEVSLHVLFRSWDWYHEAHHWIEGDGYPVALGALYRGLELAVEEISDDGFVSEEMLVPRFVGCLFLWLVLLLLHLDVWFLALPVEVFSKKVKDG